MLQRLTGKILTIVCILLMHYVLVGQDFSTDIIADTSSINLDFEKLRQTDSIGRDDLNKGVISDPLLLIQGRIPGYQSYNRHFDINANSTTHIRSIAGVGRNVAPLILIDGLIESNIESIDPNDIESIEVIKRASESSLYGSLGAGGVVKITTKSGSKSAKPLIVEYSSQIGYSSATPTINTLDADAFVAAGGRDLGSDTDWVEEVTRNAFSYNHYLRFYGKKNNIDYSISGNLRNQDGVTIGTGHDNSSLRAQIGGSFFKDKFTLRGGYAKSWKRQDVGFPEVIRYAISSNPTSPVYGEDAPFQFASEQYGGYYENVGLFDAFNPLAIADLNRNIRNENFNQSYIKGSFAILDELTLNATYDIQYNEDNGREFYSVKSLFRGQAASPMNKGRFILEDVEKEVKNFNTNLHYLKNAGKQKLSITSGFMYSDRTNSLVNYTREGFDNDDFFNLTSFETVLDAPNVYLSNSEGNRTKILSWYNAVDVDFDSGYSIGGTLRIENNENYETPIEETKHLYFGGNVDYDASRYLVNSLIKSMDFSVGFGKSGAFIYPEIFQPVMANGEIFFEHVAELYFKFALGNEKIHVGLEYYNRNFDGVFDIENSTFEEVRRGTYITNGLEALISMQLVARENFNYNTTLALSTAKTKISEYVFPDGQVIANPGAPGNGSTYMILVKPGFEVGTIYGPVFTGIGDDGFIEFEDVNNDGAVVTNFSSFFDEGNDFTSLGSGLPKFELGWQHTVKWNDWQLEGMMRGAFGHSLINTNRLFREPRYITPSNFGIVDTKYADEAINYSRYSSYYVEKADFVRLDYLSLSRDFSIGNIPVRCSFVGQNLFTITGYTGNNPEPSLRDTQPTSNTGIIFNTFDRLAPGVDRRNSFIPYRTYSFKLTLKI